MRNSAQLSFSEVDSIPKSQNLYGSVASEPHQSSVDDPLVPHVEFLGPPSRKKAYDRSFKHNFPTKAVAAIFTKIKLINL